MAEIKKFKDIPVNQIFTFNGLQYKKINEERISCCKALNASAVGDPAQKIQVMPLDDVTLEETTN
jgi:hypothetical protein